MTSVWISGTTRSGKTATLAKWLMSQASAPEKPWLVFAANGDNRMVLAQTLATLVQDRCAYVTTTPPGFIQNEVILFWPLVVELLDLKAQFPLKLRPENEQLLAGKLWQPRLENLPMMVEGWGQAQTVRRILDMLQLAANAGLGWETIAPRLQQGFASLVPKDFWATAGKALGEWRSWCLERGLLTYGIATELYGQVLLPNPRYQEQLLSRFAGTVADDVDEYSAIAARLLGTFQAAGHPQSFSYSPDGQVRLGVGADPTAVLTLATACEQVSLPPPVRAAFANQVVEWVRDPLAVPQLPDSVSLVSATTRGQMLRRVADHIADQVYRRRIEPSDIAVIGPGLDAIARYSIIDILSHRGIAVSSLKDQRPLVSSAFVRALLSLLTLVYPNLGRLTSRDAIAEMLVVLSQTPETDASLPWFDLVRIDPVRAELLADHCFVPDLNQPHLLPATRFSRWDRLGHQAADAYEKIRTWIETQKSQQQQRYPASPVMVLDRGIQDFLWRGNYLPTDQLAALRELMETAQYFWEVEQRLRLYAPSPEALSDVGRFIRLLLQGTVSANPYPTRTLEQRPEGVTLATVFQYRAQRLSHRWQFWLDAGSPRWLTGRDELFGADVFLSDWPQRPVTAADIETRHEARLDRILKDLICRTEERLILCHSDLALNGQEQLGPLLGLVNTAADEAVAVAPEVKA